MNLVLIVITILSLASSTVAWIAKIKWSKEYKDAKEAQIAALNEKLEHYRELSSAELLSYFKESKLHLEKSLEEVREELNQERIRSREGQYSLEEYKDKYESLIDDKEVLLVELHHRVKNNLAVISGMIQMYSMSENDQSTISYLEKINLKVDSIALIHELIYENRSFSKLPIIQLITKLGKRHGLELNKPNINFNLHLNTAVPLSLLLNEVFTEYKKKGVETLEIKLNYDKVSCQFVINDASSVIHAANLFKNEPHDEVSYKFFNVMKDQLRADVVFEKATKIHINIPSRLQ